MDATMVWQGLYLTGEVIHRDTTIRRRNFGPSGHYEMRNTGWFAQGGYFIKDYNLELLGRYAVSHLTDPAYDELFYPEFDGGLGQRDHRDHDRRGLLLLGARLEGDVRRG